MKLWKLEKFKYNTQRHIKYVNIDSDNAHIWYGYKINHLSHDYIVYKTATNASRLELAVNQQIL